VPFTMTVDEREAFLAGVHVGVLSVADEDGRGPLTMPIWYRYEPGGDVTFFTGLGTRKIGLLRAAGRCSLCAQSEEPPYRYVSVEGPVVSIDPATIHEERDLIAHRYLGPDGGDGWLASTAGMVASYTVVRVHPEHWLTVDFGKMEG
jgi:nitroimidazol reductase NimA-like FMN-containing flavoprotein (pyridoxamine 5'-phosphate oxidase superfamily)